MPYETLIALFALAAASVFTPGPNNAMLASSGATFGYRRTLPHTLGVALGFPIMLFAVALGLGAVFRAVPLIAEVMRWAGAALLLWIAWRTANAGTPGKGGKVRSRPFTFLEAVAFQWVNPKAWIMAISTISAFADGTAPVQTAAICAVVFTICGLGSANTWSGFGAVVQHVLGTPLRLRIFNISMALLIVMSIIMLLRADLTM